MWSAQEKNPRFRAETAGVSPDVARLCRDVEVEAAHHPEGVVLHDGDAEGRAPAAVALGLHVRDARAEGADAADVAEPGGVVEEGEFVESCDRATVRVNACDWVSSTRRSGGGSWADGRRGGSARRRLSRRSGRGA